MLALREQGKASTFFERFPDAAAEVGTGGAQPLHFCGMGRENQMATSAVIRAGGDVNALDTYGYTPLHRMASNDLEVGAEALLNAGANPNSVGASDETPEETAMMKRKVLETIRRWKRENPSGARGRSKVLGVIALGGSREDVRGAYVRTEPEQVPGGFSAVCKLQVRSVKKYSAETLFGVAFISQYSFQGWNVEKTWSKLNGGKEWFKQVYGDHMGIDKFELIPEKMPGGGHPSYMYVNQQDKLWWLDGHDGMGHATAYVPEDLRVDGPPGYHKGSGAVQHGWSPLEGDKIRLPVFLLFRDQAEFEAVLQKFKS